MLFHDDGIKVATLILSQRSVGLLSSLLSCAGRKSNESSDDKNDKATGRSKEKRI